MDLKRTFPSDGAQSSGDAQEQDLPSSPRERLLLAFELYEAGEQMMLMRLRREFPHATEDEIEQRLRHWLQASPIG